MKWKQVTFSIPTNAPELLAVFLGGFFLGFGLLFFFGVRHCI
jgi:hypothetical protein